MRHLTIFVATAGILVVTLFGLGAYWAAFAIALQCVVIVVAWRRHAPPHR
jgi:hypothetical protein